MQRSQTRYFTVVANFVPSDGQLDRLETQGLRNELVGLKTEDLMEHHEESGKFLLSVADREDRMKFVHRALVVVTALLISHRMPEVAAAKEDTEADRLLQSAILAGPMARGDEHPSKFETVLQHMDSGVALFDGAGNLRFLNVQMSRMLQ